MKSVSILVASSLFLLSTAVAANSHGQGQNMNKMPEQQQMVLKHVNPMPNLMKVIIKFSDQLNLTAQQAAALKEWRETSGPVVQALVKDIMTSEKKLHTAALNNVSAAELQPLMDKVSELRLQIASRKMQCRENMKNILDDKQWNTVVEIYKANFAS